MTSADATSSPPDDLIRILRDRLITLQTRRPGYSLRAFAKQIKIPAPVLSQLLRGKRSVTRRLAEDLCEGLALSPEHSRRILERLPTTRRGRPATSKSKASPKPLYVQLEDDHFHMISDWYYFAILSLAETEDFKSDPTWIARRLGISATQVTQALKRLQRLDLIQSQDGRLSVTGKVFSTGQDIPSAAIQKHHHQGLELAQAALTLPVELREFGATTFAGNLSLLPHAKTRLRALRREIVKILESGGKTEVFRLSVQLWPVTSLNEVKK